MSSKKANKEVDHIVHDGRVNRHGTDLGQEVTPLDLLTSSLLSSFLLFFREWLMTSDNNGLASLITFNDIIEFLRRDVVMHIGHIFQAELEDWEINDESIGSHE